MKTCPLWIPGSKQGAENCSLGKSGRWRFYFFSLFAVLNSSPDLALGDIVGSNTFNILFILGITSLIKPISINPAILATDGMVMIVASLFFLVFATKNGKIVRKEEIVLLACYIAYFAYLL